MNFICVVLVFVLISTTNADFLKDLASPKGWDMGNGLSLHLQQTDKHQIGGDFFQNHILRFKLNGYGFSIGKAPNKPAVQFSFFNNNQLEEGREEKEYGLMSVIMGYKAATIVSMTLAAMGTLVLKALGLAKIALVTSAILFMIKLFHHEKHGGHHHEHIPTYVEVEHAPEHSEVMPEVASAPATAGVGGAYQPSAAEHYYSYANYIPSGMGDNAVGFSNVEGMSADNSSIAGSQAVGRRRDISRRKSKIPLYTIHRYTVAT